LTSYVPSGAVLSHRSAADFLGLRQTERAAVDVSASGQRGRKRHGIDAHQAALPREEITLVRGIPCTTAARTLLDLADVLDRRGVEKAMERAEQLKIFDLEEVQATLALANGRRGAAVLADLLPSRPYSTLTRNDLEEAFLRLTRTANLPAPEVNAWIPFPEGDGAEADFLWRDLGLVIETDGNETHGTRQAFERDRLRDQRLALLGYQVIRFTWRQVFAEAERVAATVTKLARLRSA
jgi:Protein of unknown function (DUF559)